MATEQESVFWILADDIILRLYGYNVTRLELDSYGESYTLKMDRLGVPNSERRLTVFMDQFLSSVATGVLHPALLLNFAGALTEQAYTGFQRV